MLPDPPTLFTLTLTQWPYQSETAGAGPDMYCVHARKRASGAPRTHFRACKISKFPGETPLTQSILWGPTFCICPATPPNPLGSPWCRGLIYHINYLSAGHITGEVGGSAVLKTMYFASSRFCCN